MPAICTEDRGKLRFFVTYSGVRLPFNLISELQPSEILNRNTYYRGYFDEHQRITCVEKIAYGEIELAHSYSYRDDGSLKCATITDIDGEVTEMDFDRI